MLKKWQQKLSAPPDPVLLIGCEDRVEEIVTTLGQDAMIVDVGARSRRWPGVLALDYWGQDVDVGGNAMHLPFVDESLDGVIGLYVLEHVSHPGQAVREMWRVLRPGGILYVETPFVFGFHGHAGSYSDYTRWTRKGLMQLCSAFRSVETGVASGPASAMAYVLKECLPVLISRTDTRFYWGARALVGWLVSPLKHLDRIALGHPRCDKVAATLYCKAVK